MAAAVELNMARKKLQDALGDNCKVYFSAVKQWFRKKITKEEFDQESRKLLSPETIHLHNEFLLAVLNKCQTWTSTHANKETGSSTHSFSKDKMKKGKVKRKSRPIRATFEHRFQPVNPLHCVPPVLARDACDDERISFCVREATLPDRAMVYGRMFIMAWDSGLDAIEDDAVHLVLTAVEQHLKAILMAVFSRRHAYKLREGRFMHAIGTVPPSPYIMNSGSLHDKPTDSHPTDISLFGDHTPSAKPTLEQAEADAMLSYSCAPHNQPTLAPVSLFDLHEALQIHRQVITSHSVYAVNMERIAAKLWHPSHEEIEQEKLHQQEEEVKQQLMLRV